MFLTKEEAERRYNDRRNLFSPLNGDDPFASYVKQDRDVRQDNGSHVDDKPEEESPAGDVEQSEQSEQTEQSEQSMATSDIDRILTGAVDPYKKQRTGNLRGNVDAQVAIGGTALILGNTKTGPLFGLSRSQAQAYQNGLSSTEDMKERVNRVPDRMKRLKTVKEQLAEKAGARLNTALNSLTDDKIGACNASRISAIAKDMAVVMDKVTKDQTKAESIHFHIFRPEMKTVSEYTTVHVGSPLIIPQSPSDGGVDS